MSKSYDEIETLVIETLMFSFLASERILGKNLEGILKLGEWI